jgi:hypothetical protein
MKGGKKRKARHGAILGSCLIVLAEVPPRTSRLDTLNEFNAGGSELNEICFEGYRIRNLLRLAPYSFVGLEDPTVVLVPHHGPSEGMLHCI